MSERKVLSKYYPPDFDPSKITKTKKPKNAGPKVQTVRLMAPFPMKCIPCGEYIYKGRKFNARKETTTENYLGIPIYRFYIRCTRCSGEITFKTDPKNMDYECERGAKRNFEPWRMKDGKVESEEERLDRLEREQGEVEDKMEELESKTLDAKREMAVADALDEIRTRNARFERLDKEGVESGVRAESRDEEKERQEREDREAARRAFMRSRGMGEDGSGDSMSSGSSGMSSEVSSAAADLIAMPPPPAPFMPVIKKKKDFQAALGIKKKVEEKPVEKKIEEKKPLVAYDEEDDDDW